jgi:hypothetical protein
MLDNGAHTAHLVDSKPSASKKSIEQLGFIKDINQLVGLAGKPFPYL